MDSITAVGNKWNLFHKRFAKKSRNCSNLKMSDHTKSYRLRDRAIVVERVKNVFSSLCIIISNRDLVVCHRPLFDGVKTTATNLAVCSWALVLCVCPWQGNQTIKQNALQNKSHCSLSSSFCSALALLCLQQHTHAQLTAQGKRKTVRDHTHIMGTTGLRCAVLVITSLVWPQTLFFFPLV